jgi:ACR3 family arsenite transporter
MKLSRALEKLQNFRLLPVFVLVSMGIGVGVGKLYGISNFELTPPIDAIKAIFRGAYSFTLPNTLALGVVAGLFLMMYPAMTNIRFEDLGKAVRSKKQLFTVLFFNFSVAPFVMYALANLFFTRGTDFHTALVLYGLAPCIAMVIVFTFLAFGNSALAIVLVAMNSVLQMALIPVYANWLLGEVQFDVRVVAESVVLYLGVPLIAGVVTRRWGVRKYGEQGFRKVKSLLDTLSIVGLLFTLVVMFALKGDLIVERPGIILQLAVPMTLFFWGMFVLVYLVGWRMGFSYEDSVAVAFNSTGRDFEIAIAIAITAFNPTVALATVVGPLIEVPAMLVLVWLARRTRERLFVSAASPAVEVEPQPEAD